jgi:hypothetical protein
MTTFYVETQHHRLCDGADFFGQVMNKHSISGMHRGQIALVEGGYPPEEDYQRF